MQPHSRLAAGCRPPSSCHRPWRRQKVCCVCRRDTLAFDCLGKAHSCMTVQECYSFLPLKRYLYTSLRFFFGMSMFAGVGVFPRRLEANSTPGEQDLPCGSHIEPLRSMESSTVNACVSRQALIPAGSGCAALVGQHTRIEMQSFSPGERRNLGPTSSGGLVPLCSSAWGRQRQATSGCSKATASSA